MMLVAMWAAWVKLRLGTLINSRRFLWAVLCAAPLGFIGIEAGWTVTEVGRQPWIIYGVVKTVAAVTPMPGLQIPFFVFTLLYIFLAVIVVWLIARQVRETDKGTTEKVV